MVLLLLVLLILRFPAVWLFCFNAIAKLHIKDFIGHFILATFSSFKQFCSVLFLCFNLFIFFIYFFSLIFATFHLAFVHNNISTISVSNRSLMYITYTERIEMIRKFCEFFKASTRQIQSVKWKKIIIYNTFCPVRLRYTIHTSNP